MSECLSIPQEGLNVGHRYLHVRSLSVCMSAIQEGLSVEHQYSKFSCPLLFNKSFILSFSCSREILLVRSTSSRGSWNTSNISVTKSYIKYAKTKCLYQKKKYWVWTFFRFKNDKHHKFAYKDAYVIASIYLNRI